MPTQRPRHTITETPGVQEALDAVRRESAGGTVDLPELVVLGAQAKLAELQRERRAGIAARQWLANRVLERSVGLDPAAADAAKRASLIEH